MNTSTLETVTAPVRMLTFRQYVDGERRMLAAKYDTPLAEVAELYPDSWYRSEWWNEHVLRGFEAGAEFNPYVWRTLTWDQQYKVLRTSRALKDSTITRHLLATSKHV